MNAAIALELFGYLGSFLVLVSMLMTSVVRLRVINLIGSAIFAAYAILIRSYPTALLNGCLVGVNVYQLLRLRQTSAGSSYELQPLVGGEGFTAWFIRQYGEDIRRFFPGFDPAQAEGAEGFAVFYGNQAAGLMLGKSTEDAFEVLVDYSTPTFRDCSVGEFLYSQLPSFGVVRLSCTAESPEHAAYLEKMGFAKRSEKLYEKDLTACQQA